MAQFVINGDPAAVRDRAAAMRDKGSAFQAVADALTSVTTGGWTGRAADRFRDRFEAEPERWRVAGEGWVRAARGLEAYAGALADVQQRANWCATEYARGEEVTAQARAAYDADVARARREAASLRAQGESVTLTILPFQDPGETIRANVRSEFARAQQDLENAADTCAYEVRMGCAAAPPERGWLESGLRFVGGVLVGVGEAIWELGEMVMNLALRPVVDLADLATGNLTPEELAAKRWLSAEQVRTIITTLVKDPVGFGAEVGKALLDWDTWADDPARALGRLVPDIAATILSGGAGASVRALRGLDGLHDISMLQRPFHGLDLLLRKSDGVTLHELTGLDRLNDAELLSCVNALSPENQARLLRRGVDWDSQSLADVFGPHEYDTDYGRIANTYRDPPGPGPVHSQVLHEGPLVNLHGKGDAASGMYWTDPRELLASRTQDAALNRLALRDEWFMTGTETGYTYSPRNEITVREFSVGEDMRMQIGEIRGQDRVTEADWFSQPENVLPRPVERPDGTPIPPSRPGGATQYVIGLDRPAYDTSVRSWTGPAPWVREVPDALRGSFAAGSVAGAAASVGVGAAAEAATD